MSKVSKANEPSKPTHQRAALDALEQWIEHALAPSPGEPPSPREALRRRGNALVMMLIARLNVLADPTRADDDEDVAGAASAVAAMCDEFMRPGHGTLSPVLLELAVVVNTAAANGSNAARVVAFFAARHGVELDVPKTQAAIDAFVTQRGKWTALHAVAVAAGMNPPSARTMQNEMSASGMFRERASRP